MPLDPSRNHLLAKPPEPEKTLYPKPRPGDVWQRILGHGSRNVALVRGVIEEANGKWSASVDPGYSTPIRFTSGEGWSRESEWHPVPEGQVVTVAEVRGLISRLLSEGFENAYALIEQLGARVEELEARAHTIAARAPVVEVLPGIPVVEHPLAIEPVLVRTDAPARRRRAAQG